MTINQYRISRENWNLFDSDHRLLLEIMYIFLRICIPLKYKQMLLTVGSSLPLAQLGARVRWVPYYQHRSAQKHMHIRHTRTNSDVPCTNDQRYYSFPEYIAIDNRDAFANKRTSSSSGFSSI